MVDTVALLLMLISLLLGPSDAKELTVDIVDAKEAALETVVAKRTKTGFELYERKNGKLRGPVVYTRDKKQKHLYTVKLDPKSKPITVDAREAMASAKKRNTVPVGRFSLGIRRSGKLTYLVHTAKAKVFTIRATQTPKDK